MDSIKTNQTQKMNGLERGWHENGLPSYEGCYKNEERDGEHKEWYENGKICSHLFYKDRKLEGVQEEWDESRYILIRNNYKNGKKDGVQEMINIVDRRITQTFYKDEKLRPQEEGLG